MPEITSKTFYPFTIKQLMYFDEEVKEAGDFFKLMVRKEALQYKKENSWIVTTHYNREDYKDKYLTGVYKSLREHYYTDTPFAFWSQMNLMLSKAEKLL